MRLEVLFQPPPGGRSHLLFVPTCVKLLVELTGFWLPVGQPEEAKHSLESLPRMFGEVLASQHEHLFVTKERHPARELVHVDASRQIPGVLVESEGIIRFRSRLP